MPFPRLILSILLTIAALGTTLLPVANAQHLSGRMAARLIIQGPQFTSDDLAAMHAILELDKAQRGVLDDLHAAYIADVEAARREMTIIRDAAAAEIERTGDNRAFQDLSTIRQRYNQHTETLQQRMLDDFKLTLTDDQLARFDEFDRYYRRSRRLASQFDSVRGSSVDLIALVGRVELAAQQRGDIRPILERYAIELDRFLQDNDPEEIARRAFGDMAGIDDDAAMEMLQDPAALAGVMSRATAMAEDMRKLAIELRDINERTLRLIEAALPEPAAEAVGHEFRRAVFPEVYTETEVHTLIRTVASWDDLSEQQQTAFEHIRTEHQRQADRLNRAWAAALRSADEQESPGLFGVSMARAGGAGNEMVRRIRQDRLALDQRTSTEIRELLSPEQTGRLPGGDTIDWRSMGRWNSP